MRQEDRWITAMLMWMNYHAFITWNTPTCIAAMELYWKCLVAECVALEMTLDEIWEVALNHVRE